MSVTLQQTFTALQFSKTDPNTYVSGVNDSDKSQRFLEALLAAGIDINRDTGIARELAAGESALQAKTYNTQAAFINKDGGVTMDASVFGEMEAMGIRFKSIMAASAAAR